MESALTAVINDFLVALDEKKAVFLVVLDLTAAFNTVDHTMLLNPLKIRIGLEDTAYKWMESYLAECHQLVSVVGSQSGRQQLVRWVPQRSIVWSILFLFTHSFLVVS